MRKEENEIYVKYASGEFREKICIREFFVVILYINGELSILVATKALKTSFDFVLLRWQSE